MKKKLVKIAKQMMTLEEKLQKGENMQENLETMDKLMNSLTEEEQFEVMGYLEDNFKLNNK